MWDPSRPRVVDAPSGSESNGYPYTLGPETLADRDSWGASGYIFDTPAPRDGVVKSVSLRLQSANGQSSIEVHVYSKVKGSERSARGSRSQGRQSTNFRLMCTGTIRIDGTKAEAIQTAQVEGGTLRIRRGQYVGLFTRGGNINLSSCAKRDDIRSSVFHYPSSSSFEVGKISKFNTYGHVDASSGKILIPGYRVVIGSPVDDSNSSLARGPLDNAFASIPTIDTFKALQSILDLCLRSACTSAREKNSSTVS